MAYKKFIKRDGKVFGPYYYESYRDKNGTVKKKYLGTINPDEGKKKSDSKGNFSFLYSVKKKINLGFLNSSRLVRKKITPTKKKVFNRFSSSKNNSSLLHGIKKSKVLVIPILILIILVFGWAIYGNLDSGHLDSIHDSFENANNFISDSFFKIVGLVVIDSEAEESEVILEDFEGGKGTKDTAEDVEVVSEKGSGDVNEVVKEVVKKDEVDGVLIDSLGLNETVDKEDEVLDANESVEDNATVDEITKINETTVNETIINETISEPNETIINETIVNESISEPNETIINETISEPNETIINETLTNETLINKTIINETIINETIINETITNETLINETILNETLINETISPFVVENLTTLQYKAVINRPVKWLKKINVSTSANLTIEIPKLAENISVLTDEEISEAEREIDDYEILVIEADKEEIVSGFLTGNVVADIGSGEGFLTKLWNWFSDFTISGNVVYEEELEANEEIIETVDSKIIDVEAIVNKTNADEVGVSYYTPAPLVVEQNISWGKLVTISADEVYNYTDILAYSLVEGMGIHVNSTYGLKVYWRASYEDAVRYGYVSGEGAGKSMVGGNESASEIVELINASEGNKSFVNKSEINETDLEINVSDENKIKEVKSLLTGNIVKNVGEKLLILEGGKNISEYIRVEVNFSVHDLDGDGFVDYVEWIVPHLSNQTYEITISILNVQSYPTVGGNWTVGFNTTGVGNLSVSAFNGTTYGFNSLNGSADLEFLELKCGDDVRNVSVIMNETKVPYDVYLKKKRIEEIRRELYG